MASSLSSSASAATANCSASTAGTQLPRTAWAASASNVGDPPSQAIDGNLTTRYSSGAAQAAGMWFQVNMGSVQSFDEIDMEVPNSAGDYARGYSVEVSNNGTTFTTVESCTGTSSSEIASFALQSAQYIRIVLTASISPNWWSIDEFYAYNTGSGSTTTTTAATTTTTAATTTTTAATTTTTTGGGGANCSASASGTQLSRTAWAASASNVGDPPANAIDGNLTTRYSSGAGQAVGMWFQVNMSSAQSFNEIDMEVPNSAGDYARGFTVGVSSNGTSFTTVATCTGTGPSEIVSFPAQTDQYLRVTLNTAYAASWWSIDEFYAYGGGSGGTTTTTAATTTTTAATTTTTAATTTTTKATTTTTAATTTTVAGGANCSASASGESQLNESAFVGSSSVSTASGVQVPITNAVNGNNNAGRFTTGAAQAPGMNYEVNMGSAQSFNEVDMEVPDSAGDYPRGFNVQVSRNGTSWTTVASCTGTSASEIVSFPAQSAQYVQVVLTASIAPNWWSMEQFIVRSASSGGTTTTTAATTTTTTGPTTTTTVASGANCSAVVNEGMLNESAFVATTNAPSPASDAPQNAITNAVKTEDNSRFSTDEDQAVGLYFQVNMQSAQTFNEIDMVTSGGSTDYARGYQVLVSNNGSTWTAVASCTGTGSPEVVSFPSQTAQYLEVVLTTAVNTNWWSINQFYILGSGGTTSWGAFPASFWGNTSTIPVTNGMVTFDFLNETFGAYPDSQVYWSYNGTTESIAQQPYLTVGNCTSCRITFYLGSPTSSYTDFIEFDTGTSSTGILSINIDTSRVDAFGLPVAMHVHSSDGSDQVVGEDYTAFSESRTTLFQQFQNFVPTPFQHLATVDAPYKVIAPQDDSAFQPGGTYANYMTAYAQANGASSSDTTAQIFGCAATDVSGNAAFCAALNRGVAQYAQSSWGNTSLYYQAAPCNFYSAFWHTVAVNGLQYGFPYDDSNGQSSDIGASSPQYVQLAIGF